MQLPLATSGCIVPVEKFWHAILVYHDRPNIVNKKIVGVSQAYFYNIKLNCVKDVNEFFTRSAIIYEKRKLPEMTKHCMTEFVKNILEPYSKELNFSETDYDTFRQASTGLFISLRILLPKQSGTERCIEVVVVDKRHSKVTFHAVCDKNERVVAPPFPYTLELTSAGQVRVVIDNFEDAESNSAEWLVDKLFYKLMKWVDDDNSFVAVQQSLSLIDLEKYTTLYQSMKMKYGQKFIDIWPENTDPLKFVYEDVAIAAYLICLWDKIDPTKKPSFVDLGCGNGLLVHILSQEGFPGHGVDVRRRKIWDLYSDDTKLEVRTLVPSSSSLFPEADWIIGNHSDELTPWIPVIAARSSSRTNFFVLPCCSYDFSGRKYSRKDTSKSQYSEYLEYIMDICRECGFSAKVDKLRIPSTKKTCIVSFNRTNPEIIDEELTEFINSRSGCGSPENSSDWVSNFEARQQVERVKNCTKLEKDLIQRIICDVFQKLLEGKNLLQKQDGHMWNAGRVITFEDLASCLSREDLKHLKNECGGLQTFLRNHRYIFEVVRGTVKIRVPGTYLEVTKYKSKHCWFLDNHPDGCLHDAVSCAYEHI